MKRFLQILLISAINIVLAGCSSDLKGNQMNVSSVLDKGSAVTPASIPGLPASIAIQTIKKPAPVIKAPVVKDSKKEEKVIISINNFGRTNPFRPFEEKIITGDASILPLLKNLPPPPMYAPNNNITNLMQTKVNGILYDPVRPSAIISVTSPDQKGQPITKDYLIHKGDMIFNYYIKDILADRVVIKYGNNLYTPGIGEIIGGAIDQYPVKGESKTFGGLQKAGSASNIKIVTPSYTSSFN